MGRHRRSRPAGAAARQADNPQVPPGALELAADAVTLVPPGEVKAGKPAVLLLRAQRPTFTCESAHQSSISTPGVIDDRSG